MREPVSRFILATAQEFYGEGDKAKDFRDLCLKDTPKKTLQCSIDYVKDILHNNVSCVRIHLVPAAALFYWRNVDHDLPIEMVEFDTGVPYLLEELGGSPKLQMNNHESEKKHMGSDVIANLHVRELSREMIDEICELYAMDVAMLKHLGMKEDPYCGGVVSTKYLEEVGLLS